MGGDFWTPEISRKEQLVNYKAKQYTSRFERFLGYLIQHIEMVNLIRI